MNCIKEEFDLSTNEGRLAYARKHYPVGTKYYSINAFGVVRTQVSISTYEPIEWNIEYLHGIQVEKNGLIYCQKTNKWAEIIKQEEKVMETQKFKIGDSVKIIKPGKVYDTYTHMFCELGFKNKTKNIDFRECGVVFGVSRHHQFKDDIIVAIRNENGDECLIHQDGLELVKQVETQKLSREGLKEIHSAACDSWKKQLEEYGSRNPLENYVELTQEEVDAMFKASTKNQLTIVSKYLKLDDSVVDLSKSTIINSRGFYDKSNKRILTIRAGGKYQDKSFYLSDEYEWEMKLDESGCMCLIPTKKKK